MMFMLLYAQYKIPYQSTLMTQRPEPIRTYLNGGGSLAELQRQSRHLQQFCDVVRRCLPDMLARHLLACSISDSQLTLYAASASRATPLRLTTQKLLQKLHQDHGLKQIKTIRVRISEITNQHQASRPQAQYLASETAALLGELADTAIDPEIKKILHRLAGRRRIKNPLDQ